MDKLNRHACHDGLLQNNNSLDNINNHTFGINFPQIKDTCQVHQGARLDYLCVDSAQNFLFKCMYCVTDDNTNQLTLIPIEQILISDSKTVFANFPLKDRELTKEIKQIAQNPPTGTLIKQSIDTFFKEFRAKLLDRIDSIQKKMTEKAQSISDFGEVLISNYNRVSSKDQIKQIVSDSQKSIENRSTELKDICAEALSKDEENTQLFTQLINSMKTLKIATDFETPKLIQESILNQLESINMFLVDDIAHLQRQLLNTAPQMQQQQGQQNSGLNAVTNLMKLVHNKFNDVSQESCEKLQAQLNQFSFIISQLDIPIPGPVFENIHRFNEDETRIFKGLICEAAKEKEVQRAQLANLEQIDGDSRENNEREKLKSDEITDLVKNHTNFCSGEFIEDFSKVMATISGLLGLFSVRKSRCKSIKRAAFNGLNEKQLDDFAKLAAQVNQLTLNHSDLYLHSKLPLPQIQAISSEVVQLIGKHYIFRTDQSNEKVQLKKDMEQLLVQYPIFELLPNLVFFKRLPISFTRTQYIKSSEMGITENGNEVEVTFPNYSGKIGQVVSETLKNQSGYLIRLKFNRPYGNQASGKFLMGLILNSKIDSNCLLSIDSKGFSSFLNNGAEIVTRGSRLSSNTLRSELTEVEIRWCISKRQFFISDLTYQNVNQVKEDHFTPTEIYRFGICFYEIHESDWKVTITDFFEIDPAEVSRFQ